MKKFNLQEIVVSMGLFDFSVVCVIGNYKYLGKYIQWKFEDNNFDPENFDLEYECRGKCCFRRGYVPVIWIPRKPQTAREHATLAHECLHAVFHLFDWASLKSNRETEEVMAHSVAHLITNILCSQKS